MTDLTASRPDLPRVPSGLRWRGLTAISVDALALPAVAALAAVLYLVNLTVSAYGNTYYAMAAQAASQSRPALFFGALDGQGFITLDKPPLATALMGLSVKAYGLSFRRTRAAPAGSWPPRARRRAPASSSRPACR